MKTEELRGRMLSVKDGWVTCPTCRRNKRMLRIEPDTKATHFVAFCRDCKTEHILDIYEGRCFESQSR